MCTLVGIVCACIVVFYCVRAMCQSYTLLWLEGPSMPPKHCFTVPCVPCLLCELTGVTVETIRVLISMLHREMKGLPWHADHPQSGSDVPRADRRPIDNGRRSRPPQR